MFIPIMSYLGLFIKLPEEKEKRNLGIIISLPKTQIKDKILEKEINLKEGDMVLLKVRNIIRKG